MCTYMGSLLHRITLSNTSQLIWLGIMILVIIECDGYAMIIDGGLPGQSNKVYSFIRNDLK